MYISVLCIYQCIARLAIAQVNCKIRLLAPLAMASALVGEAAAATEHGEGPQLMELLNQETGRMGVYELKVTLYIYCLLYTSDAADE